MSLHTSDERREDRLTMVESQIEARGVRDPLVLAALRSVPRHEFLPADCAAHAYADGPLSIGAGQTISQPYIVALMTESLALRPDDKVLEIGTGCGYQTAILSAITPRVFTIEIVPELAESARRTFERLGLREIAVRHGDGWAGWPEAAPFNAILVAAAAAQVPPALIDQLVAGGRLCIPIGRVTDDQQLLVITKHADGNTSQRTLGPVRFVPMTGAARRPR